MGATLLPFLFLIGLVGSMRAFSDVLLVNLSPDFDIWRYSWLELPEYPVRCSLLVWRLPDEISRPLPFSRSLSLTCSTTLEPKSCFARSSDFSCVCDCVDFKVW